MKLLLFSDTLALGGKQRRLSELVKALLEFSQIEFELALMSYDIHYKNISNAKIQIHYLIRKRKKDVSIFYKFYKLCKSFQPDIVHCWDSMTAIYCAPICKILNIKLINGMVIDTPVVNNIFNKHWLRARLSFKFSDIIVGNSNAGLKAYKAPDQKSICIYNGIDLTRFVNIVNPTIVKKKLGLGKSCDEYYIGMVAAFEDRKDYDSLIEAAAKLTKEYCNMYFILVGGGNNLEKIKNKVPLSLRKQIIFLGIRNDIESIVNILDIGVLLTNSTVHGEGISNSLLEYMALSKPVIATRGGGTNELIAEGVNGLLIDPGDVGNLVYNIKNLMIDKSLCSRLGSNANKIINEKFNIQVMTDNYISLYNRILH